MVSSWAQSKIKVDPSGPPPHWSDPLEHICSRRIRAKARPTSARLRLSFTQGSRLMFLQQMCLRRARLGCARLITTSRSLRVTSLRPPYRSIVNMSFPRCRSHFRVAGLGSSRPPPCPPSHPGGQNTPARLSNTLETSRGQVASECEGRGPRRTPRGTPLVLPV